MNPLIPSRQMLSRFIVILCFAIPETTTIAQGTEQKTSAIQAVRENNSKALAALLDASPDAVNEKDRSGFTAAHWAAILDSTECLALLAKKVPKLLTNQANDGTTAAFLAAQYNNVECLKLIAQYCKPSLSIKRGEILPSHVAAVSDNIESLAIIANEAPDTLSTQDDWGNTPAHAAIAEADSRRALLFLKEKAPGTFEMKNKDGLTVLELAKKLNRTACVRICNGEKLSDDDLGAPKHTNWVEVKAPSTIVRNMGHWISTTTREFDGKPIGSHYDVSVKTNRKLWEIPQEAPARLMFFTSAKNPLTDLSNLKAEATEGEFVCWDGNATDFCFYFLARAGLAPPYAQRGDFQIKLKGDGYFGELFNPSSKVKLLVTYSTFEPMLRTNGAVPVYFVEKTSASNDKAERRTVVSNAPSGSKIVSDKPSFDSPPKNWPNYSGELSGVHEARVKNPNDFKVRVGLRSDGKGKDFIVSPNGTESVNIPNGRYDIYFHYSSDPDGLYQGDSFTLENNGVEITITKVVNGNYRIRKVK